VNTKVNDDIIELSGIIVLESMIGHGVGTALLRSVIAGATSDGTKHLVVKTERTNTRAIQFYQNHGFCFHKEATMTINEKSVELVILELTLT
jgi:ribosomal protein S18 acetylase RimI-like enzyme